MYCKKCGNELGENAKFCKNCGFEVTRLAIPAEGGATLQSASVKNEAAPIEKKETPKKKKSILKKMCILFIIVAFLILMCCGGLWTYKFVQQLTDVETDVELTDEQAELERLERVEARKKEKEEALLAEIEGDPVEEAEVTIEMTEESADVSQDETVVEESEEDSAIHNYQIVKMDCFWEDAYEKAIESGGYLARINSSEEMNAIVAQIQAEGQGDGIFWLGGMRMNDSYSYHWIDENGVLIGDELNGQEFWLDGEPSMWDSTLEMEENYINMFYMESQGRFIWNDTVNNLPEVAPAYEGKIGFIIEFE